MTKKQTYQFQAEMEQLLDLLAHSLYTEKEIFLRELISNASDTLNKIRFLSLTEKEILGQDQDLKIQVRVLEKEKKIEIEDNGMGMTEKELKENIGTIAKSGTANFLKNLKKNQNLEQIGQFGVGFYSVFMVTDKVEVETCYYKSKKAFRWVSEGKSSYTIEAIEKKNRGTKISFQLKKEAEEFANTYRIENIIQKYSNFVPFPILVNEEQKNQPEAIWRKSKNELKEEDYKNFFQHISHSSGEPLFTIHYSVEAPVQFQALLFASSEKEMNPFHPDNQNLNRLHLYIQRVFIQDDCKELVPRWMRFIYGVVDTEDLPLNVSREVTQKSPIIMKMSQLLAKKVVAEFQQINKKDSDKFLQIWENFGMFIKEGIYGDLENKEKLLEIYYLHSSKSSDKLIALKEVVERKEKSVKEIYYIQGKDKATIEANPNMEYFLKKEIEVLYLYEEIDEVVLPAIGEYKEVRFLPIDRAKLEKEEQPEKLSEQETKFLIYLKDILGEKVADVIFSKRLVNSPCSLVSSKDALDPSVERLLQMSQKDYQKTKKVLEVNPNNPLIQKILEIKKLRPQDALVKNIVEQLYDNALFLEESLPQASSMVPRLQQMMLDYADNYLKQLQKK